MKGVRIKIIFGWRPYWSATLLTGLLTKSVESIGSRTVVTQGHSQRTYADQVGEDPVFPRTSSRLTEKLSPCLGGPLNKVEINIAEFMTINTKTVFKPCFYEIENPTSWKRRMFFRRLFRTFIMWKKNRCLHHWTLTPPHSGIPHRSDYIHDWINFVQFIPGNSFRVSSCLIEHWHLLGAGLPFMRQGKGSNCKDEKQAVNLGV